MKTVDELMAEHSISVWQDPHWDEGRVGTPRWLAGSGITAVSISDGCTTCGWGAEASIEADNTASGETPSEAVRACAALREVKSS